MIDLPSKDVKHMRKVIWTVPVIIIFLLATQLKSTEILMACDGFSTYKYEKSFFGRVKIRQKLGPEDWDDFCTRDRMHTNGLIITCDTRDIDITAPYYGLVILNFDKFTYQRYPNNNKMGGDRLDRCFLLDN
jgi:hypothetical protein